VAVNAIGDVLDPTARCWPARATPTAGWAHAGCRLLAGAADTRVMAGMATTIGVVATDAR
jgi:L-aminopeptidase/D-esterase-like protein